MDRIEIHEKSTVKEKRLAVLKQAILSVSGWRKIFSENQDPESPAVKRRTEKINAQNKFMTENMTGIASALAVYKDIIALKNMLINKLNKVDTIKTLLRTEKGYEVVNPEGFVAIGTDNGAVKLVDRMEFSKNNFNAVKNWSKG